MSSSQTAAFRFAMLDGLPECPREPALDSNSRGSTSVTAVLDAVQDEHWDEGGRGPATIFQSRRWMHAVAETYGYSVQAAVVLRDQQAIGKLPWMEVDSWLTGRRGISLPFTDECAPQTVSPGVAALLIEAALRVGRQRRWRYLELRGGARPSPDACVATSFYGHELDLSIGTEHLKTALHPSVRRAIRKAQQSGVEVELSPDPEALGAFHRLMQRTRRRHGLPTPPLHFYRKIHEGLIAQGNGFVALAKAAGTTVAAAMFLFRDGQAIYKYGASDERHQHLRANNLVFWKAICDLTQRGCKSLDFGRTSLHNEGLRRFKLSWGTQERLIEYFRYSFQQQRWVSAIDRSTGWHSKVFQHLPLVISSAVGRLLYRHIP